MATQKDSVLGTPSQWGISRYSLAGALVCLCILAALVALVVTGSGGSGTAAHGSKQSAQLSIPPQHHGTASTTRTSSNLATPGALGHEKNNQASKGSVAAGAGKVAAAEERDPEEAKSFPVSASTTAHHQAAKAPSAAGEAAVAPGALSDAQVRKKLREETDAKAQEQAARKQALTPQEGGFSVGGNGTIPVPSGVPEAVARVVAGGNAIADFPYIWGGGHASFIANGYDCSGSVSYALAAGGLLSAPLVSGELAHWGEPGPGRYITIYANAGHTFMDVDGVWFDTAGRSGPYASRWLVATPSLSGYSVRHPPGF
jgi:cell wall-associated NlpC family hydrolase